MCIIFHVKEARPDDNMLQRAQERNSDGIGLAWRETIKGERLVRWEKGLTVDYLLEKLHKKEPPKPYVIHFRKASVGATDPRLCHPFVVTPRTPLDLKGTAKTVLFHNGHWNSWRFDLKRLIMERRKEIPTGPWTDSRAIAFFFAVYGPGVTAFEDFGGDQRLLLFSADENKTFRWGSWSAREGFDHSNPSKDWMGAINIAPEVDLWKQEEETEGKGKKAKGGTQFLLEAAKAVMTGARVGKKSKKNEESTPLDSSRFWSNDELRQVLIELRQFAFKEYTLCRQKAA